MPRGVYKRTEEGIKNLSLAHQGSRGYWKNKKRLELSGEKHFNWKGGISQNKEYISWLKNKRNRLKGAIRKELGGHTYGEWELLKKQYGYNCPCCKKPEPEIKLTEDHIVPLSKGGSDLIENIQPLCLSCNCKKHTKSNKF